ncbi:HlyD family secretion protein [Gibbsiella quercinecans]|uniref:HlyD family secretion protein n=1 Tax=Gibbsiella quercinecans TaxID=929813 RepID=UPI003F673AC5
MIVVPPPVAGTVVDIRVKEGQQVKQGDILVVLSSEVSTRLGPTRQVISENLAEQRARLLADLKTLNEMKNVEIQGLYEDIRSLNMQKEQLNLQLSHRKKQVALAKAQMDKLNQMRKEGYASNRQVDEQESTVLENQARLQEYHRQLLDTEQKIYQTQQKIKESPLDSARRINEVERRLAENAQSVAENESRRSFELRSPKDGIVGTIMVKNGQMLNAGQNAIAVLPNSNELIARIMVGTKAVGFIEPGQKVVLRYKAFPYQKFGQKYGKVVEVSRTALSPQDVAHLLGVNNVQEQQYRVLVQLDEQAIQAYARNEQLKPGMALDADFLIDKRRLYEWVLEPLFALGHNISA